MTCPIPKAPPFTTALTALPNDAHAYAQSFLDASIANARPLGYFERETHDGQRLVKQYTHHTTCNGVSGTCCPAVTLFADTSPPGTPDSGVSPIGVNWLAVAVSGAAAGVVIAAFVLALKHAGRAHR